MKSGLHMSEYSNGGLPPGSPEARAAIERIRQKNGSAPTLKELDQRKYLAMQDTKQVEAVEVRTLPERKPKEPKLPTTYQRTCVVCPSEFTSLVPNKITCSDACKAKWSSVRHKKNYTPRPQPKRPFQCATCGTVGESVVARRKFCNKTCRNRWHHLNMRNRINETGVAV